MKLKFMFFIFNFPSRLFIGERDEIHAKFSSSVLDLQQKSNMKYVVLEKKIALMRGELNVREAQLHNVMSTEAKMQQESSRRLPGELC